jgi:hypothetical protein
VTASVLTLATPSDVAMIIALPLAWFCRYINEGIPA